MLISRLTKYRSSQVKSLHCILGGADNLKTTELTRLQVGDAATTPVNIIVSTVVEAEKIVPLLKEYQTKGREANVSAVMPAMIILFDYAFSSQFDELGSL